VDDEAMSKPAGTRNRRKNDLNSDCGALKDQASSKI
jgi:hypothetical protein